MDLFTQLIPMLMASPVLPVVVVVCCLIDGIFPPIPSEMTVVGALAAALATVAPPAWIALIVVAAAIGAVAGDSLAFAIGRRLGMARIHRLRNGRLRAVAARITQRMQESPASIVLVGRYIPGDRVAVNAIAGASGLRYRRYLALSAAAGVAWAGMCLVIAASSAAWLGDPLWSALAAIVIMGGVGLVVDAVMRRRGKIKS